jgi:hypothetical protein
MAMLPKMLQPDNIIIDYSLEHKKTEYVSLKPPIHEVRNELENLLNLIN